MSNMLRPAKENARSEEPAWLFVIYRNEQYYGWSEAEDKDVRDVLKIDAEDELPMVCVHRFNNRGANEYRRNRGRKFRNLGKEVPPEVQDKIVLDSVAHKVLADWKLISIEGDEPTPYSPQAGITYFEQDPDFYDLIVLLASKQEYHRAAALKEDAEALGEVSRGTSNGEESSNG